MREELNFEVEPAVTLGYENLAFPFLVLMGGLLVACIITSCEKIGIIYLRNKRYLLIYVDNINPLTGTWSLWGGMCKRNSYGIRKRRNWR